MALHASASIAARGWRVPRVARHAGISASTAINGRGCALIATAPEGVLACLRERFGRCSLAGVKTLYRAAEVACPSHRRKLNDPESRLSFLRASETEKRQSMVVCSPLRWCSQFAISRMSVSASGGLASLTNRPRQNTPAYRPRCPHGTKGALGDSYSPRMTAL